MLRYIAVEGFRSLIGFEISLHSGLNVLVGPNGTGKSNFISFLDFMSDLFGGGLSSAIANAKGAGEVFSQEKFSEEEAELAFSLEGLTTDNRVLDLWGSKEHEFESIQYHYGCRIKYLKSVPAVFISDEFFTIVVNGAEPISVNRETRRDGGNFISSVRTTPSRHPFFSRILRWLSKEERSLEKGEQISRRVGPETPIFNMLAAEHPWITAVMMDVGRYRSINIDPNLARKPSPVGTTSEIAATGEGLAGVLYRLERGSYQPMGGRRWLSPRTGAEEQKNTFARIASWTREVVGDVSRPEIILDFHEALLRPQFVFLHNGREVRFPLKRVSDGTVKWLALVTILLAEKMLSVIEEPENFLHPFMQESFVALCRDALTDDPHRIVVLSTHSPTLLDCCEPQELIIFSLERGQTRASLVENWAELSEAISKSRFRLGHFYRTGGVYGADRSVS